MWVVDRGWAFHSWGLSVQIVALVIAACVCTQLYRLLRCALTVILLCLHSAAFVVVWGAGTALAASPPEKPAERSSREATHATPHELYELHETHPLS